MVVYLKRKIDRYDEYFEFISDGNNTNTSFKETLD